MSTVYAMLDLAVIIVSWNVRDYLADCLRSVYADLQRSGLSGEIWVIDNASTDGTQELLTDLFPQVNILFNKSNPGFGVASNQGMRAAALADGPGPRHFLLLNPDTMVRPGALGQMVACLDELPEAGVVGARLVYGDGRFQHSAFNFPGVTQLAFDLFPLPDRLYESGLNGRYPRKCYRPSASPFAVDHPLGAAMLVRRDVAEATGGFDESYYMYCEEIDWCWRIREAGWSIFTVPKAEVVHYGGVSTKQVPADSIINLWRSRSFLYSRHHSRLRYALAGLVVQMGMKRKARRANSHAVRDAYEEAAAIWRQGNVAVR